MYFRLTIKCILMLLLISQTYAFNLSEAYQSALQFNADYLAQMAKTDAGRESQVQGRALLLPQLSVTAAINENYLDSPTTLYYNQTTAGVTLQQTLVDFNKFSQYTKSKFATKVSELELANARQELMVKVAQGYFDVLYANDVRAAILQKKNAFNKQFIVAESSFQAGSVTIADVNDAKSSLDMAIAEEIQANTDLMNKKNIFHNLTGLNPDLIQPLNAQVDLVSPVPESVEAWAVLAKSKNVQVQIANTQVEMALQDIKIAKAGHLPTVNLIGSYQYQGEPNITSGGASNNPMIGVSGNVPGGFLSSYNVAAIGLQVSIPLYSGGGINSQVRQAMAVYEKSWQQQVMKQREIEQRVQKAYWAVLNGVAIVQAQTQALKSAKLKLKSDEISYTIGTRNSVDLVNSEQNYAAAIQDYNQARYDYLIARLQLMYLSGKIDVEYLALINANITM